MDKITKLYEADDLQLNDGSREFIAVITAETLDRDNEVVISRGLQKKQYAGNAVICTFHDYSKFPIGSCRWVKAQDNQVIAKGYITDKTQEGRDAWNLMKDGVLRAFSVGFIPLECGKPTPTELQEHPDWKQAERVIRRWELFEFSVCAVPCNPDALLLATAKQFTPTQLKILGPDYQVKDYWAYDKKEEVKNIEADLIERMKTAKSWKTVEKRLAGLVTSHNELMNKITGKA